MTIKTFQRQLWATAAAISFLGMTAGAAAAADDASTIDELIVTGTRDTTRTQFTTLAPVDVLSEEAVKASVSPALGDSLAALVPSFNVQKLPTSDGLQFVRPATLRNLSPDQTLVLVNGKRFHRSGFLLTRGAQAPDLAQIAPFAVQHIEVLRDGASAQYGSDAIAGVINIILNDQVGYSAFAQGSEYYKGDGRTYRLGGRAGFAIGDGGHLSATAEWSNGDATSRSHQRQDAIDFQKAHPGIKVDDPVQRWGNPDLETFNLAIDAAIPLGTFAEAYGFGTYGKSDGVNDINWRNPDANPSIYKITPVFPGFDLNKLYPGGFTPREGIDAKDFQTVFGVRQREGETFTWDLSASYGRNDTSFFLDNSINASLGPASPTSFNLGHLIQTEFNLNADAVYRLAVGGLAEPVNIAFGAERRLENYEIVAGDPASYAVGPGAAVGLAPNSNGFPGYNPQQAGEWDQESYAAYLDVESQVTEQWSLGGAVRYEDFSEFGDTVNGKIATRFAFTPDLAVRASYSTGFRAPTPAQLNSTSTSQGLDTVTLQLFTSGRLSPLNPVAEFLGAKPLEPEKSETLTGGFVWRTDYGFSGSIDAYQIDVTKRFSTSPTITVTPAIRAQLVALGVSGADAFTSVSWFTNDFDTRTKGIDLVGSYRRAIGEGDLTLTGAYNYNKTKVTSGALSASATQKLLFEEARPEQNLTGTATYAFGPVELLGRVRYYGKWTDSTGNSTGEIFQEFGGITFFDVAVTYKATDNLKVRVGAENVFDTYPDEAVFQASRGLVYSRNAPYDTNGGLYYVRVDANF